MSTLATHAAPQPRSVAQIYWKEAKYEFLKALRMPAYSLPTILFPVMFYCLFGLSFLKNQPAGGVSMAAYLLATYGAFGVIGAALFGFGVGVAMERGQGWMILKRASPMPPSAYFTAKIVMSTVFGLTIVILLFGLGYFFGGVRLPVGGWLALLAVLVAGAVPFSALGLAVGYTAGPNSAVAIVNLIYLPMAFASGLWIPVAVLPSFFQKLAPWLPAYHYSQLALKRIGADVGDSTTSHLLYLAVFTALCLGVAYLGYRRDEGKTYG